MNLSEKISALRKQSGMSQEQLAEKIGISRQAVSGWENGDSTPEIDNILRLGEIFGVTMDYLLKDEFEDAYKENEHVREDEENNKWSWNFDEKDRTYSVHKSRKNRNIFVSNAYNIAAVAYLIMGFVWGLWHPGWIVFLVASAVQSFSIYTIATIIFLVLGFMFDMWSFAWIAFPAAWLLRTLIKDFRRNRREY